MKSHRRRRLAAGIALMIAVPLSGCSAAVHPGDAAVIGDRVVTEDDIRTVMAEVPSLQLPQQVDASAAAQYLALGPILIETLHKHGVPIGSAEARAMLRNPTAHISEPTDELLQTMTAINLVQQAQQYAAQPSPGGANADLARRVVAANQEFATRMRADLTDGSIVINPKYFKQPSNWILQEQGTEPAAQQ